MSQAESEVGSISAVEELLAIEEIKRVFAARLRCMDTKQWHVYPTLHTADVVSETWGGLPTDKQPKTGATHTQVVDIEKLTPAVPKCFLISGETSRRCIYLIYANLKEFGKRYFVRLCGFGKVRLYGLVALL